MDTHQAQLTEVATPGQDEEAPLPSYGSLLVWVEHRIMREIITADATLRKNKLYHSISAFHTCAFSLFLHTPTAFSALRPEDSHKSIVFSQGVYH